VELYTLTSNFFLNEQVGVFTSLIWTERYAAAGDIQLVVEPSPSMINALKPGTFLSLRGTKEIMRVDTQTIQDELMTVTGSSIIAWLNNRLAWFTNPSYDPTASGDTKYADLVQTKKAGQFLSDVVHDLLVDPTDFVSPYDTINLDWARDKIDGLVLGHIDTEGDSKELTFPIGPLYDGLTQIANNEELGIKLYLESANFSTGDHVLKFATYRGKDRTSNQDVNDLVRFSSDMDTLFSAQEIISDTLYKNLAYSVYKNVVSHYHTPGTTIIPTGWDRRVVEVEGDKSLHPHSDAETLRRLVAWDTLRKAIRTRSVDGEVSWKTGYAFGRDYYLGDVVELKGPTGVIGTARVTEYIRSQDQYGERDYPTFNPLDSYVSSSYTQEWTNSPNWDPGETPTSPPTDSTIGMPPTIPPSTGDGGETCAGDVNLTSLMDKIASGWVQPDSAALVGYYVHKGRVYLQGSILATPTANQTVLTGLPSSIRPSSPSAVTVGILTTELPDLGDRQLPMQYSVTVHTDGTVALTDPIPDYVGLAPPDYHWGGLGSPTVPNYPYPLGLELELGQISWDLTPTDDTYSEISLEPYLGSDFENIDAKISRHCTRVHLSGKIKALRNGAGDGQLDPFLLRGIPAEYEIDKFDLAPANRRGYTAATTADGKIFPIDVWASGSPYFANATLETDQGPTTPTLPTGWRMWIGPTYGQPFNGLMGFDQSNRLYVAPDIPGQNPKTILENESSSLYTGIGYINVADVLAFFQSPDPSFWTPPDWIAVHATIVVSHVDASPAWPLPTPTIIPTVSSQLLNDSDGLPAIINPAGAESVLKGWVCKPSAEYSGDPTNQASVALWKPGEINRIDFAAGYTSVAGDQFSNRNWSAWLNVVIFYETRKFYLKFDDVLDLTGAGWNIAI
jgi:hypothetical protein